MKHRWITVLTILCMVAGTVVAGAGEPPQLAPGEQAVVRVYYPDLHTGNRIVISFEAQLLETNRAQGYHVMRVNREDIDRLTAAGLTVVLDETWVPEVSATRKPGEAGIPGYPCYRTVDETFASAAFLASSHPGLVQWVDVGDSWEKSVGTGGSDMQVLKLTNQAVGGEDKPVLFVTAAMHAREYATAELVTRFGEYLVNNYGTDADATWILDYHQVHLMLQTNPDGRKIAEDHDLWRKNTNADYCQADFDSRGADLNRNFSFRWACCGGSSDDECSAVYHGTWGASEPEISAVEAYMAEVFTNQWPEDETKPAPDDTTGIYIDVHSYSRLVLWPWGSTGDPAPNATQLQTLGRKFAYWNDYSPEQAIGLYPTDGTSDEHAYGTYGVAAYCFEIGTSFFQPCTPFEKTIFPDNLPALVYAAKVAGSPYITPKGPDATAVSVGTMPAGAGRIVTLSAVIDDTRYKILTGKDENEPVQTIAAAEYYIDAPPWNGGTAMPMTAVDGVLDSPVEAMSARIATARLDAGRHIVFVRGQDADGNWGAVSAVFLDVSE